MEDKVYTLLDLAEEFGKDKQFIRRRISRLKLRAINKDSREHINEPLEYDHQAFLKLSEELGVSKFKKDKANETRDDTQKLSDDINKDKVIEVLERELEHSKDKLRKSEEEKETLMRLLDQQQRLSLQANQKIEILESKDQEIKEKIKDGEKKKWWQIFKKV
jgi:Zn-dependent metalloprotease